MTAKASRPLNPNVQLFGPTAIFVSSLLFSPLVGGFMAATNWRRAGEPKRAWQTALLAAGAMAVMLLAVLFAPPSWETAQRGAVIGGTMGAAMAFRNEQRPLFEAHVARGGAKASPLVPVVFGILLLGAALAVLFMS